MRSHRAAFSHSGTIFGRASGIGTLDMLADERSYNLVELLSCLEVGGMARFGDDVELRAGDDLRDLFQDC